MADALLEMKDICKSFPGVKANDHVDFTMYPGEVHALLGENGAGKSTLMSILTGIYKPDAGQIRYKGEIVHFRSPRDSVSAGVGMVHQHFRLVDSHTVTENIILGMKNIPQFMDRKKISLQVLDFSKKYGLEVDPTAKIWQLSVGEQQRVEIIKALYKGAELLILDEPTAVLTPQEVEELFNTLRKMAEDQKAVVVITHKMHEVLAVADRVTVLRNGTTVGSRLREEVDREELTKMMVGKEICVERNLDVEMIAGDPILEMKNVFAINDKGLPALRNVSLQIRPGEILGIAGVAGNGQREITEVIAGLRKLQSGEILLNGKIITNHSPLSLIHQGISLIPEDRTGMGLVPGLDLIKNFLLKGYHDKSYTRNGIINYKKAKQDTMKAVKEFEIKMAGIKKPVRLMSGGNQQKLLLSREVSKEPVLIVAAYPIRGLDIGATQTVHRILLEQKKRGAAILLISEDLEELLCMADQIGVLYSGEIMGIVDGRTANVSEIGVMMVGMKKKEEGLV